MRFSIVVPVFNVEQYLPQCLKSIGSQTFDDFEVILVNDGSTDGSLELCKSFKATSDHRVVVINQDNKGLLVARSVGCAAASGDYLVSLDSDDALRVDALQVINEAISLTGADVVFYGFSRQPDFKEPIYPPLKPDHLYESDELREIFCSTNRLNPMCFKAISRSCVGAPDLFDRFGRLNMGEDAIQSAFAYDKAENAILVKEALYYYRPNDCSISKRVGRSYLVDMERVHECLLEYAVKWDGGRKDAVCVESLTPKCVEEVCHFVLHYCSGLSYGSSREALVAAASSAFIRKAAGRPSDLKGYAAHTRLLARFLASGRLRSAWLLAQIGSRFLWRGGQ